MNDDVHVCNINSPVERSASLSVKFLREKKSKNHRAMFSGESRVAGSGSCSMVIHASIMFVS